MDTAQVIYSGNLRTEARHLRSGNVLITDAPVDNQGLGEAFSPTDLLATALASCLMTIMGITAKGRDWPLHGLKARVVKHMGGPPRQVDRIEVHVELDGRDLPEHARRVLEEAARNCPVARSLRADLVQDITFTYTTGN